MVRKELNLTKEVGGYDYLTTLSVDLSQVSRVSMADDWSVTH